MASSGNQKVNRKKANELTQLFGLEVAQSRYSDWGNFYGLIKKYPCALWDKSGYVIFRDESELEIPGVLVSKRINVPKGISSLPNYKCVINNHRLPEELPADFGYQEGSAERILVNKYERDSKARTACILAYGYACQVCSVKLSDIYGAIAENFIHVHHITPISDKGGQSYQVDPLADLIPVCPTCHAILHRRNPPYSPEEVRGMILNSRRE